MFGGVTPCHGLLMYSITCIIVLTESVRVGAFFLIDRIQRGT